MKRLALCMALLVVASAGMGAKKMIQSKGKPILIQKGPGWEDGMAYATFGHWKSNEKKATAKVYGMNINTRDIEPQSVGIRIEDRKGRASYSITGGSCCPSLFNARVDVSHLKPARANKPKTIYAEIGKPIPGKVVAVESYVTDDSVVMGNLYTKNAYQFSAIKGAKQATDKPYVGIGQINIRGMDHSPTQWNGICDQTCLEALDNINIHNTINAIKGEKGPPNDGNFAGDFVFKVSPKPNEIREVVRFPAANKTAILQLSEIKSFTVTTKAGKTERFTIDPKTRKATLLKPTE